MKTISDVINKKTDKQYSTYKKDSITKGEFNELSSLDQRHYNDCINRCNRCTSKELCTQDIKFMIPVIVNTDTGNTTLYWDYCDKNNMDYKSNGMEDL